MSEPPSHQQLAAAETYQQLFVPAEFEEWAPRVIAAARVRGGQRVLDVACGTGVLAREARRHVGASGFVAGIDPDPGMLAVAARLSPTIEWRQGAAEHLPYAAASFDTVVSQFGLPYFADRVGALREMFRVLAPRGRLAIAVWDTLDRTPAYATLIALLEEIGGRRAADALRVPFALGDPRELEALFSQAGAADVRVSTHEGVGRFASARAMVEAELEGWLPIVGITLGQEQLERLVAEVERRLAASIDAGGRITYASPAHIVTAGKGSA